MLATKKVGRHKIGSILYKLN